MSSSDDYYAILGVARDDDESTIKRQYRKLALQYHPDKNKDAGAEDMFKKISRCYQVLSDPQKRKVYDTYGAEAVEQEGCGSGFMDPSSVFEQFFGGGAPGGGGGFFMPGMGMPGMGMPGMGMPGMGMPGMMGGTGRRPSPPKPISKIAAKIKVATLVQGGTVSVSFTEEVLKNLDTGETYTQVQACRPCNGSGTETKTQMLGPGMFQQMRGTCSVCEGRGYTAPDENIMWVSDVKQFDVVVPVCHELNEPIVLPNRGKLHFMDGQLRPTDLHVYAQCVDDPTDEWKLENRDLVWRPMLHAVFGLVSNRIRCPHLDGKVYIFKMTQNRTDPMIVPRHGLGSTRGTRAGNLVIRIQWDWNVQQLQNVSWFTKMRRSVREQTGPWLSESTSYTDRCYSASEYASQENDAAEGGEGAAPQCQQS
jgi:DnaJ-class molecular chaperone